MITVLLLLIVTGSVFITSELFKEVENSAKNYYVIISALIILIVCFISKKGVQKLIESMRVRLFYNGIVLICMLSSMHGILQYLGFFPSNHYAFSITGSFENPAGFAAIQAALFPFVFTQCFAIETGKALKCLSAIVSVLCATSVVMAGSRTGSLAICSAIVIVLYFTSTASIVIKKHRWLWLLLLILTGSLLITLYYIKKDSADGRLFIWCRCIDLIKERPILGHGVYGFHRCYMSTQADFFQMHPDSPYVMLADNVSHPLNEYIKLAVNHGLVGLAVAIALLVLIVHRLFKCDEQTKVLGLSFVASVFIMCQFSYPLRYATVWLLAAIAVVPALIINERIAFPKWIRITLTSLLVTILSLTTRRMYFEMKWTEISKRALIGQVDRMLKYYDGMPYCMKRNPLFLYNYAAELNYAGHHEESVSMALQCANMWNDYDVQLLLANNYAHLHNKEKAIQSYNKACNMIPCRFEPLFGEMLVYRDFNDSVNALRIANEICDKPVKINSERIAFIVDYAQQFLLDYEL